MVWKRYDRVIDSDLHARTPFWALGFWAYLLDIADTLGRFPADPARLLSILNRRPKLHIPQVVASLTELSRTGLIHLYHPAANGSGDRDHTGIAGDSRQYGVIHEFVRHIPPGALRYISPTHPPPPAGLCACVLLSVPSPSSSSPPPVSVAHLAAPRPRRPSPSPSSSGKEGMQGEKGERGVYGRAPDQKPRRAPPRPDCPKCRGTGYYQSDSMTVGNVRLSPITVACECREEKTA